MQPLISISLFRFLLLLCTLAALPGLFIPLMDNDAAHHALIAMRIHLTGDYVNLIDHGKDYLDKPHLHFWLSSFSFSVFGLNGFAYKLPSFLFSIVGVYSTYKLGERLYSKDTGRLAALMMASSFGYLLSVSDVRMDAILVSCIALASWQLIAFIQGGKKINLPGSAFGLALGFSTKGHIALLIPILLAFLYLVWKKDLRQLLSWNWIVLVLLFLVFISPVLYSYYIQFNLHPEKTVRGETNINGVRFILFDQVVERLKGNMETRTNHDPFFFFHSWIPAFAPWSLLTFIAIADRLRKIRKANIEFGTALLIVIVVLLVSMSRYQLPHYLNVVFPSAAVLTASFIIFHPNSPKWTQTLVVTQMVISFLILLAAALLNAWVFPVGNMFVIIGVIILLSLVFYFLKSKQYELRQKALLVSASSMIFFFFLMNTNFYPRLLEYQGGKVLAGSAKDMVEVRDIYVWDNTFSSSFHFYTQGLRQAFRDSVLEEKKEVWLLFDQHEENVIREKYDLGDTVLSADDFEVTRLNLKFLDPNTRRGELSKLVLARVSRK